MVDLMWQRKNEEFMEAKFWLNKWDKKEIGFHYSEPNPLLIDHFKKLGIDEGDKILLPLCGKTADLLWLMKQNVSVFGVELSETAIKEFFIENELQYQTENDKGFTVYFGENIRIYHGDFFTFHNEINLKFKAIYDRASLVALPEKMRLNYFREIKKLLEDKGHYFLISFEYDQEAMSGPPFCVDKNEVVRNLDFKLLEEERSLNKQMSQRTKTDFLTCYYLFEK